MSFRKQRIAFVYDFDGTLAPGNMQEYDFIPKLKLTSKTFWNEVKRRAKDQQADEILAYMYLMLRKAKENDMRVTRQDFKQYAKGIEMFPGVSGWFDRVDDYAKEKGLIPQHYIISSGIREMLLGTSIANKFTDVFASSFMYDQHGVAEAPGLAVNYTTKTQFLFRINKGVRDICDNKKINQYIESDQREVPFTNMIFIGDGATDVPCMRLVKAQGGHSIAVYKPKTSKELAEQLRSEGRVHYVAPADYSKGKHMDKVAHAIIDKVAAYWAAKKL
jgi:phosphoserine phosphatase